MKILKSILFLALSLPCVAQTAKVLQLTPDEAKQAKTLYDQQAALEKQIADFHDAITKKYLHEKNVAGYDPKTFAGWLYTEGQSKPGWFNGFEYSEDFQFIVPKSYTPSVITCDGYYTATPAIGIFN